MKLILSMCVYCLCITMILLFASCTLYIALKDVCTVKIQKREIDKNISKGMCKIIGRVNYNCFEISDGVPFVIVLKDEAMAKTFKYPYFEWEIPAGRHSLGFKLGTEKVEIKNVVFEAQEKIILDVVLDCEAEPI